jgi:FkbM family methyltransferase
MLISLDELIKKYNIYLKGILHVGAHECEEIFLYEKYLPRNKILWVDALHDKVELCKSKYPDLLIELAVVSDKKEIVNWNRSNNGQSSSILNLGLHKQFHPDVHYVLSGKREAVPLSDFIENYDISYNFINLDIQGAELKALKGMESYLNDVDYVYTEVNCDYVYEECALIEEIDQYLLQFNLHRVETSWFGDCKWGDAFYIRKN